MNVCYMESQAGHNGFFHLGQRNSIIRNQLTIFMQLVIYSFRDKILQFFCSKHSKSSVLVLALLVDATN